MAEAATGLDLGLPEDEVLEVIADVRCRNEARPGLDVTGKLEAGRAMMSTARSTPYIKPHRDGRLVNKDEAPAETVIEPAERKAD